MKCPNCNTNLIWGGDNDYDEIWEGTTDGIISNYTCPEGECFVTTVVVYQNLDHFDLPKDDE